MLGDMPNGASDAKANQSYGRRQRIKANSSEKLPPLQSNKQIATEHGNGSRKRLLHPPDVGNALSEKASRQKQHAVLDSNHDSQ